jgi:hypothetical protein
MSWSLVGILAVGNGVRYTRLSGLCERHMGIAVRCMSVDFNT